MENWKQAIWLATFEFKHSIKNIFLLIGFTIFIVLFIRSIVPAYLEEPTMGLDFFFVIIFCGLFVYLTRPKVFQLQKMRSIHYGTPFIIALNHLAIKKEVIIKYRFLTYFSLFAFYSGLLFLAFYPSFQQVMTLESYLAFSVIWVCFGIYIGSANPTFEAYFNLGWNIFYGLFIGNILFFSYLYIFFKWYKDGLVSWTIYMAKEQPILSIVLSLVLAIVGWNFWMRMMKRKMNRTDFL